MDENVFRIVVTVAVALACLAFVVQAVVVIALYRLAKNAQGRVAPLADKAGPIIDKLGPVADKLGPMADQVAPILANARQILEENRPRLTEISAEALAAVKSARVQAERAGELLKDAGERAKVRIEQIDRSVDETVAQVEEVGGAVKRAVLRPVREVNGIMSGVSAAFSAYLHGRKYSVDHATQDEEMFI
jgi:hypothetical protein